MSKLIKNPYEFIQTVSLLNSIESAGIALLTVFRLQGWLSSDRLYAVAFIVYFLTRMVHSFLTYKLMKEKKK